jgi:hypothetical protein
VRVYICGAVADILREFQRKLEKHGVEVVGAEEHTASRTFTPPQSAEALVIGTDQASHPATQKMVAWCKDRNIPYAMGELRKWSLIYPRLVQAGILGPNEPAEQEEEEAMAPAPVKLVKEEVPEGTREVVLGLIGALKTYADSLRGKGITATIDFKNDEAEGTVTWAEGAASIHYSNGKAYAEATYTAHLKVEL